MDRILIDPERITQLVYAFDILAAIVFAVSGALVASRKGLDFMGFMWLGAITGIGGGTVRDLILGVPVFWVQNPVFISVCLGAAMAMHFVAPLVESRYQALLWFDAFGLALVSVAGTAKAHELGASAVVAIAMGAVTGTVGGMIRDTLGHVPSVLLRHEIYITASVLGAGLFIVLRDLGVERSVAMTAGFALTFVVRGLAIRYHWTLPVFRAAETAGRWTNRRRSGNDTETK
ncbi:MAG TPA: trimeric intracellular cation channel family protein [Gemmatimonadaceae bacterium]|nr:trimeric intracellular cation channel family protein [Gemmatimonadaceae bacterium]HRQ77377.1 trimeric intracellular cation channel family protein [Gemmatimonadaceae bacterium]